MESRDGGEEKGEDGQEEGCLHYGEAKGFLVLLMTVKCLSKWSQGLVGEEALGGRKDVELRLEGTP